MNQEKRVPITIITGFLGAGKTTLINNFLQKWEQKKVGVIVNDLGQVNIDSQIIESRNPKTQTDDRLVQLENGCICCTQRKKMIRKIRQLIRSQHVDHILIESSGISDPLPISVAFEYKNKSGKCVSDICYLDTIITVIDCFNIVDYVIYLQLQDQQYENKSIRDLIVRQIQFSNIIILNKQDLVTPIQIQAVYDLILRLNPNVQLLNSQYCQISYYFIGLKLFQKSSIKQQMAYKNDLKMMQQDQFMNPQQQYGVTAFTFEARRPFHPQKLWNYLEYNKWYGTLRCKGYIWLASRNDIMGMINVQGKVRQIEFQSVWMAAIKPEWWISTVQYLQLQTNLITNGKWQQQWGDRRQEIIFIGFILDKSEVLEGLEQCLLSDEEMKLTTRWSQFEDPFPSDTHQKFYRIKNLSKSYYFNIQVHSSYNFNFIYILLKGRLRIRNQILIFQTFIVAIIFTLSCILSLALFDKFQLFIKEEVLEKMIIRGIISMANIVIFEINQLGNIEINQTTSVSKSLANLYEFQVNNNVRVFSEIENCLQTPYQKQFYSYQFCSGLYGNITNTDLQQLKTFISLQNQIIPVSYLNLYESYYNAYLDDSLYFSQYKGDYLVELKEEIKEALSSMINQQLNNYRKQLISEGIPGTKIAYGSQQNLSKFAFIKAREQIIYEQRTIGMLLNGFIISDSQNNSTGEYFQNTSITGFNSTQFEKIINFTFNSSAVSECEQTLQDIFLCLIDNNQKKLIFPILVDNSNIIVVIVDTLQIIQVRNQSYELLQCFMERQIYFLVSFIIASFLLCLLFQIILILMLNKPLKQLENSAKYHIYQNKYQTILSFSFNQSEISKLNDSFFNIIHSNKKIYTKRTVIKQQKQEKQFGMIQERHINIINFQIREQIESLIE
ncbi:hypothetical protein pb186bvf_020967 [Paramecium bursaria]